MLRAMGAKFADRKGADDETAVRMAKVDVIMKKHGLDPDKEPTGEITEDMKEMVVEFKKDLSPVKDRAVFLGEMLQVLSDPEGYGLKGPDLKAIFGGELKNVKVEGDSATATLVRTQNGQEQSTPYAFKLVDGIWLIDVLEMGPGGL